MVEFPAIATLSGRRALVTGAAHGMGRTHCVELARRGAQVAALDIDETALTETVKVAVEIAGEVEAFAVDVTSRAQVEGAIRQIAERWGGIDIVVSNAGLINDGRSLIDTDDAEWHRMFAVNVDGALNICRASCPWLKRSGAGRVIIVSSMWAQSGPGHSYSYVAAKGALLSFAKNLAVELAPFGVLVNALAPGSVRTRMIPDPELELAEWPIPIGRMAEPEEVSYLVAFLASDQAAFITGQTIAINGGAQIVGI